MDFNRLTGTSARIDLLKSIPLLFNSSLIQSPYLLKAKLSECTMYKTPCIHACGKIHACDADAVLDSSATCRVWECLKHETSCPNSHEPWGVFSSECGPIEKIIEPPFHFVCVESAQENRIKCGFDTALLPQGGIVLDCHVGSCHNQDDNENSAPIEVVANFEHVTEYSLILLVPFFYTLILYCIVHVRDRKTRHYFELACALENQHQEHDDETSEVAHMNNINAAPINFSRPSPDLTFSNLTFAVHTKKNVERVILNSVSGSIPSAQLCCIIGPSGSGRVFIT
jgi:hypothetical protein